MSPAIGPALQLVQPRANLSLQLIFWFKYVNGIVCLQVETELQAAGLNTNAISGIMGAMQMRSLEDVQQLLGQDNEAVQQLQRLFQLTEGYGFRAWLVYEASIVRGLAYYTGKAHIDMADV